MKVRYKVGNWCFKGRTPERVWLGRLFLICSVLFTIDFLRYNWHINFRSINRSSEPLGLWNRAAKHSHDDYSSRVRENQDYKTIVNDNYDKRKTTDGRFFIYQWDESITNRWPLADTHHRLSIPAIYAANHGIGPLVNISQGRYMTHQYSLFRTLLTRLQDSPLRTFNPAEAAAFFIPYDFGMDSSTRRSDGALALTECPTKKKVVELLTNSPYFQVSHGEDHFMLHSINQMMLHFTPLENCMDVYASCYNCTKLGIDAYPKQLFAPIAKNPYLSHKWISVPFPSDFHMSAAVTDVLWKYPQTGTAQSKFSDRNILIAYMGSTSVSAKKQKELRNEIVRECERRMNERKSKVKVAVAGTGTDARVNEDLRECLVIKLSSHESHALLPSQLSSLHNRSSRVELSDGMKTTLDHVPVEHLSSRPMTSGSVSLYSISRLCLCPGGDFPTRKAFFDSLLSGCVPVTFHPSAALIQWPWHWSDGDTAQSIKVAGECTILMPYIEFMSDPSLAMQKLASYAVDEALMGRKRRCISEVAMRMQYNVPGKARLQGLGYGSKDAVDVILDRLLNRKGKI